MCDQQWILDENFTEMVCECFIGISINTSTLMVVTFVYMVTTLVTTIGKCILIYCLHGVISACFVVICYLLTSSKINQETNRLSNTFVFLPHTQ